MATLDRSVYATANLEATRIDKGDKQMGHSRFVQYIEGFFGDRYKIDIKVREYPDQPVLITVLDSNSQKQASVGTTAMNVLDISKMLEIASELKSRTAE